MRGNFHGCGAATSVRDLGKQFLKIERFGCRTGRGQNALTDFIAHRAKQTTTHSRFLANVLDQESGRRFAVGARNGGELQFSRGKIVKSRGEIRERAARRSEERRVGRGGRERE